MDYLRFSSIQVAAELAALPGHGGEDVEPGRAGADVVAAKFLAEGGDIAGGDALLTLMDWGIALRRRWHPRHRRAVKQGTEGVSGT